MKKECTTRALLGALAGMSISLLFGIFSSALLGDGNFYPVTSTLLERMGSEFAAVAAQTAASAVYGCVWGVTTLFYEQEHWSLLHQTLLHLIINSIVTFVIAYAMGWMTPTVVGAILYFVIFFLVYAMIWVGIYFSIKRRIDKMNQAVRRYGEPPASPNQ